MAAKHYKTNNSKTNQHDHNNNIQEKEVVIENTSRVCIKNVPPSCNESNLKSHLMSSSTSVGGSGSGSVIVTDCKIIRTKDGKSRKLAFVGFKTPEVSGKHVGIDIFISFFMY